MKDTCILCKKETDYYLTDHIDNRYGYVEGTGQLCYDCYSSNLQPTDTLHLPLATVLNQPNDQKLGSLVRKLTFKKFFGI